MLATNNDNGMIFDNIIIVASIKSDMTRGTTINKPLKTMILTRTDPVA